MASVVCCATFEVKYRKWGGGCKVLNDTSVQISDTDLYLNKIMQKTNFHSFISVRMTSIHNRPLHAADSDDSDDSGEDTQEEEEAETARPPVVGVEQ